jgi:hypothetical protein
MKKDDEKGTIGLIPARTRVVHLVDAGGATIV